MILFGACVLMLTKMASLTHPGEVDPNYIEEMSRVTCEYSIRRLLDPVLVLSVIRLESCFNPRAVSATGDRGLMQLHSKSRVGPQLYFGLRKCDLLRTRCNIKWGTYILALWKRKCKGGHHWLRHYNWHGASGKYHLRVLWVRAAYKAAWKGKTKAYQMIRTRSFPRKIRSCLKRRDLCIR